jgi:uncharacterized protein YndB with AHSA1/START domain
MAQVEYVIHTAPEQVFAVLADGWGYSNWVVGTAYVRDVDPTFPAAGSGLRHRSGPWPVSIEDESTVLQCEPPYLLVLKVRTWPAGAAVVRVMLAPEGTDATRVTMAEQAVEGPLRWVRAGLDGLVLRRRNRESLRRLADLAVHRTRARPATGSPPADVPDQYRVP